MALTYKSAGVNKHEGYNEVNLIKKFIKILIQKVFFLI